MPACGYLRRPKERLVDPLELDLKVKSGCEEAGIGVGNPIQV